MLAQMLNEARSQGVRHGCYKWLIIDGDDHFHFEIIPEKVLSVEENTLQ